MASLHSVPAGPTPGPVGPVPSGPEGVPEVCLEGRAVVGNEDCYERG